jgi:hypothetical protein
MSINKDDLKTVLSLVKIDENGVVYKRGKFVELFSKLHTNYVISKNNGSLYNDYQQIHQDMWKMETVFSKIVWENKLWKQNTLDDGAWIEFAQIDIDYFHVVFRSCFDHIASAISDLPSSHSCPKSFNKLQKWILKPDNFKRIDENISSLIKTCNWFNEIKDIRDLTVHEDGSTLVFLEKTSDKILFQTYGNWKERISISKIMYNQNVVIFDLYAGLYYSYLLVFLEKLSEIIDSSLGLKAHGKDPRSSHTGLFFIIKWVNELLLL